jgi:ATP-dependent exoDNAse (exonuclease V) beta subunit
VSIAKMSKRASRSLFDLDQSIRQHFLGWDKPILHAARDFLFDKYCRGNYWNLDQCILVLPGSYAGRRLTQLLATKAHQEGLVLRPPEVLTIGSLPEKLYNAKHPFASDLEQTLAWTNVLRAADPDFLRPLLLELPDPDELRPWMELGKMLGTLHRELASDLMDFSAVAAELADDQEVVRWQVLARLQRSYLDELHEAGLWDVQSARRYAIEHNEVQTDREVILVGTVDLNRAQRSFLRAIPSNVCVLIGAPKSFEPGFADDGTLLAEYWQDLEVPLQPEMIHVRSTPTDAARELAIQLANLGNAYGAQDVTVGIPDPALVPILQETLAASDVYLRFGPGVPITQSPPLRLIDTIVEYLSDGSIESFNRLVRVPCVQRWLATHVVQEETSGDHVSQTKSGVDQLLIDIDRYQEATLLRSVNQSVWPEHSLKDRFLAVIGRIDDWLRPLRTSKQRLVEWSGPLRTVIHAIYENEEVHADDELGNLYVRSSVEVNAVIEMLQSVPSRLDVPLSLSEAYTWVLGQLESTHVPPLQREDAIEMLGWLDLALDDSPVLMLTGMHDGVVPESVNGDAFLPNKLRAALGLMDNVRRYARDCYAMLTMLHTREQVQIILNELSLDGDPQTPSRLLMSVPANELAPRVRWLLDPKPIAEDDDVATDWLPRLGQSNIPIPVPSADTQIRDMAVTDFKKYDQCPYRFYLRRIEKAKAFEHERLELDGGGFGDLVHKVLEFLKGSTVETSTDPKQIEEFLVERLKEQAKKQFGVQPPPALQIQLEQAERRLSAFSVCQANYAAEGWRIKYIEYTVDKNDGLPLDLGNGQSMMIHGRIDRIDYNPREGTYAVWDYKTGDQTTKPRENHLRTNKTWIDWQLPLYGLLIRKLKIEDLSKVRFGYILLPRNPKETEFVDAKFTVEEHVAAIESAKEIARRVYGGEFWPPKYRGIHPFDEYNSITQHSVARRWEKEVADKETEDAQLKSLASSVHPLPELLDSRLDEAVESNVPQQKTLKKRSPPVPNKLRFEEHHAEGEPDRDWFSPRMILASAGTGKTFNLATRALRLLFSDEPIDSILATTFTRKAAGEILHRVLSWLANAIDDTNTFALLKEQLEPLKIERSTVQYQLSRLCSHLHRFRVSTLDSFYSQLARSFALELKLPPGWSLCDPFQYEQIKQEAISRMFETMDRGALKSLVSQLSKGEATRSIRREIETVVSNGYDLFRRTTESAWNQLQVPTGPTADEVTQALATFQASTLQHSGYLKSRDAAVSKFEAEEWADFLGTTLVQRCDEPRLTYSSKEVDPEAVKALRILARKAACEELASRRAQNEAAFRLLHNFDQQLRAVKTKRRTVTFDDISERLALWMNETIAKHRAKSDEPNNAPLSAQMEGQPSTQDTNPSTNLDNVSYRLDCPIHHLLLDEFQDTSPVQWEIVKPFAQAIVESQLDRTSFFCVGDSKQAIYGWRGGVAEIFESVGEQIQRVKQEKLTLSRRSSPIVIDFVNDVFTQLDKHQHYYDGDEAEVDSGDSRAIVDWTTKNFLKHETAKLTLPGYVEFRNADVEKKRTPDEEVSADGLLEEVADRIADLHSANPHAEIGVLSRTNRDVGRMILLLRERGVEASQEGGNPLTDSAPVLLVLSLMRLANHPADSLAHFHVTHSPLMPSDESTDASRNPLDDPSVWRDPNQLSIAVRSLIDAQGFGHTLGLIADRMAGQCNERDQDRLRQLIQLGYRFDGMSVDSIFGFVEFVEQHKVALPGASKVRVMTIHQSKGLEFDAVFLPTLDQTIISRPPSFVAMFADRTKPPIGVVRYMNRSIQKFLDDSWRIAFREYANQQLAEALCVFYVALTRARQALYLYTSPSSSSKKRWGSVLHSIFASDDQKDKRGALIQSWGDPHWYEGIKGEEPSPDVKAILLNRPRRRISLRKSETGARVLPWIRPSTVSQATSVVRLGSRWTAADHSGAVVGKLVHRWFEEIRGWIEDFKPNKKRLKEIAAASLTQEEMAHVRLNDWVDQFVKYCDMPTVLKALSVDRYRSWHQPRMLHLEITNERRLLQVIDGQMLRGVIDRCVLGFDGDRVVRAEILDFKTDRRPQDMDIETWVQDRLEHHGPQLECYRRVLCDQFGLHRHDITLTLLLLSEDREVTVPFEWRLSGNADN